jgi:hypothetical protein
MEGGETMIEKEFILLEPQSGHVLKSSEVIESLNDLGVEFNPNTPCHTYEVTQIGDTVLFLLEVQDDECFAEIEPN